MNFISIPIRNLRRRPLRSALTLLGIAVAVSAFVALVGISKGVEQAWTSSLVERGTHMLAVPKGVVELLTASIDEKLSDDLSRIKGIQAVSGELSNLASLGSGEKILIAGWPANSYLWTTLRLSHGVLPKPGHSSHVLIGETLASLLDKEIGGSIKLHSRSFKVGGIFKPAGVLADKTLILSLPDAQELIKRQGKVTVFHLRFSRPDDTNAVAEVQSRLERAFPDLTFIKTQEIAEQNDILRMLRAFAWSVSLVTLLMAAIIILNTLLMSVTERKKEIGILSAVGWQESRILYMIIAEGFILTVAGSFIGTLLGIMELNWLARLPGLRGFVEYDVSLRLVTEVFCATIILGIIASAYPAWKSIRLRIVDTLNYE